MESNAVGAFNAELVSLYEHQLPISKKKMVDITKAAMRAIKYYKHVVYGIEQFITKCTREYKLPGLYCIDSIVRQCRHEFKDKDVFGPRFAINMPITLANLLNEGEEADKLKVVRVLNLWKSHEIFEEGKIERWLEYCRLEHRLETDFLKVEKAVKGDRADMSIYSRLLAKAEERTRNEPQTLTPPPLVISADTPELLPTREPSAEGVDGGITEEEIVKMLVGMGLDLGGMFSANPLLVSRVHKLVIDKLAERRELDFRQQGNVKGLLADFDYSDDESPADDGATLKLQSDLKPNELTKQQIIGMVEVVLRDPGTKDFIQKMYMEQISAQQQFRILAEAQMARVQVAQQSGLMGTPVSALPFQPSVSLGTILPVPRPSLPGTLPLSTLLPSSVQTSSQILPSSTTAREQDDSLCRRRSDERAERDRRDGGDTGVDRERTRRYEQRRERSGDHERSRRDRRHSRGYEGDDSTSKRWRRHSRSGEWRSPGHGRHDQRRSDTDDRTETYRDRDDRDRYEPAFKEMERSKRKMGLPFPPKKGHLLIASRTLWLGRIPPSCSSEDIRLSVIEAGEPDRISIIHSRACAYVTMKDRKSAFHVIDRFERPIRVAMKSVKLDWAIGQGLKGEKFMDYWDSARGISLIPYSKLPDDLDPLIEGGYLDIDTLPPNLAGQYDEHGLKKKIALDKPAPSVSAASEVQLPPSIPSFPFAMCQPPPLSGGPPFFPPGMIPLPGLFSPPLGAIPSAGLASSQATITLSSKETTTAETSSATPLSASLPQQQAVPLNLVNGAGARMPYSTAFELNGNGAPFVPRGFGSLPPPCYPPGAVGFVPRPSAFTGGRFAPRGGFDGAFWCRPPFPGGQFPVLGGPPRGFYLQGAPRFAVPPPVSFRKTECDEIGNIPARDLHQSGSDSRADSSGDRDRSRDNPAGLLSDFDYGDDGTPDDEKGPDKLPNALRTTELTKEQTATELTTKEQTIGSSKQPAEDERVEEVEISEGNLRDAEAELERDIALPPPDE